ncbi:pyridoxal phosphate-dependent transferase [Phascolomyces articulosus]|uniref:Pyridoxal phosphate-dependent transferase n=1 Tax=Phascolomyces articulosus TaxID=60185 RepID=A0AAD5JS12_9FUNG|nr:pyridoxal phosphate-dependent transferase [Phascolomyces articulosus]
MVNFLKGLPSTDLLSTERVGRATKLALDLPNAASTLLQYNDFIGDRGFLNNLATFLSKAHNDKVEAKNLCASSGASHMLEHILAMLTRPESVTKYALFQNPTYHLSFRIFEETGFTKDQFVGIPEDNQYGLDVDYLEAFLKDKFGSGQDNGKDDYYDAVLYCVPTHANPSSTILPEEQREKLVKLARQYNVLVICDDVYDLLTYQGTMPKRVVAYDLESNDGSSKPVIISNGSFSKILAPGMRVGWIEAHEALIKRIGLSGSYESGSSPSNFSSIIVSQMLCTEDPEISLESNIENLKKILYDRLIEGVWKPFQELLEPLGCSSTLPAGGYFLWVRLPPGVPCELLKQVIATHKIDMVLGYGNLFSTPRREPNTDEFSDHLRLCFAHYTTKELQEGMKSLENVIRLALEQKTL